MSDNPAEARRRAGKRLLGGLLMAGGGMIALLCGLCTVVVMLPVLQAPGPGLEYSLILAVILGGFPTLVGVVLFWIGLRLWREGGAPPGKPWKEFE